MLSSKLPRFWVKMEYMNNHKYWVLGAYQQKLAVVVKPRHKSGFFGRKFQRPVDVTAIIHTYYIYNNTK